MSDLIGQRNPNVWKHLLDHCRWRCYTRDFLPKTSP